MTEAAVIAPGDGAALPATLGAPRKGAPLAPLQIASAPYMAAVRRISETILKLVLYQPGSETIPKLVSYSVHFRKAQLAVPEISIESSSSFNRGRNQATPFFSFYRSSEEC